MTSPQILVHYGFHSGATGSHFADVVLAQSAGYPRPCEQGEHFYSSLARNCGYYLWIESGTCSYPLDVWNIPVPTAGYLIDSHQHPDLSRLQAAMFDVVFVAQQRFLPVARQINPNSYWLPLAAPSWFLEQPSSGRHYEFGFVGSLSQSWRRRTLLLDLQTRFITNEFERQYSVKQMAKIYAASQCVVNPPVAEDLNMRFFEAMACGAALITPAFDNGMAEVATANEHFKTADFGDPEDVSRTIRDLLQSGEAGVLGARARDLVRERHTYEHRLAEVIARLGSVSQTSPIRSWPTKERARHMLEVAEMVRDMRLVMSAARRLRSDPRVPKALAHVAAASLRRALRS